MSKHTLLIISSFFSLFISCNNKKEEKDISTAPKQTEINSVQKDTATIKQTYSKPDSVNPNNNTQPVSKGNELKKEDPVSQHAAHQSPSVKRYLKELKSRWKNTANPIIATYEGNDFGDYHHIIFKDAKGNTYDFGQAANNYGKYKLHELSGQYEDNPAYVGKKFKVYWEWKLSHFLCCEGDYDKAKAYLPAITKLELIKN